MFIYDLCFEVFKMLTNEIRLCFVASFPYFTQDHCGVESIKNGQRHGNVHDYDPRPQPIKVLLERIHIGTRLLQSVNRPHGEVTHLSLNSLISKKTRETQ